jgi:hypothetical protein
MTVAVPFNQEDFKLGAGRPEQTLQSCSTCPGWFWNARRCIQCKIDEIERALKMRKVLETTAMYKEWIGILSDSNVNVPRRAIILLELNSRLSWLQGRQEYIRVETERAIREVEIGHDPDHCRCQGVSGWVFLDHVPIELIVNQNTTLAHAHG